MTIHDRTRLIVLLTRIRQNASSRSIPPGYWRILLDAPRSDKMRHRGAYPLGTGAFCRIFRKKRACTESLIPVQTPSFVLSKIFSPASHRSPICVSTGPINIASAGSQFTSHNWDFVSHFASFASLSTISPPVISHQKQSPVLHPDGALVTSKPKR